MKKLTKLLLLFSLMNGFLFFTTNDFNQNTKIVLYFENHNVVLNNEKREATLKAVTSILKDIVEEENNVIPAMYSNQFFELTFEVNKDFLLNEVINIGNEVETRFTELNDVEQDNQISLLRNKISGLLMIIEEKNSDANLNKNEDITYRIALQDYAESMSDLAFLEYSDENKITLVKFSSAKIVSPTLTFQWLWLSLISLILAFIIQFKVRLSL
jgi:hypothetical protein